MDQVDSELVFFSQPELDLKKTAAPMEFFLSQDPTNLHLPIFTTRSQIPELQEATPCSGLARYLFFSGALSLSMTMHLLMAILALTLMVAPQPTNILSLQLLPALGSSAPGPISPTSKIPGSEKTSMVPSPAEQQPQSFSPPARVEKSTPPEPQPQKQIKPDPLPKVASKSEVKVNKPTPPIKSPESTKDQVTKIMEDSEAVAQAWPPTEEDNISQEPASGQNPEHQNMGGGGRGLNSDPHLSSGPLSAHFGAADGPRFLRQIMPKYPEIARRRGLEGVIVLRLTIDAAGKLKDVQIVEGGERYFEEAALAAVKASQYAPATKNGQNIECSALLPIRFALRKS